MTAMLQVCFVCVILPVVVPVMMACSHGNPLMVSVSPVFLASNARRLRLTAGSMAEVGTSDEAPDSDIASIVPPLFCFICAKSIS